MLIVLTPKQSADGAIEKLRSAMKHLAEAQREVIEAQETLAMFSGNFDKGYYKQENSSSAVILGSETKITSSDLCYYQMYNETCNLIKGHSGDHRHV